MNSLRPDLACIASWIKPGACVLDLGCGDGTLMSTLLDKNCSGYGVEISDEAIVSCIKKGVNVIQQDIEAGLDMFRNAVFDVVVLSMAIQATHQTEKVLSEMSQVGFECIVSLPNFGYWRHPLSILKGRMPISKEMPYEWFNTPNLHWATTWDFEDFLSRLGLKVLGKAFFCLGKPINWWPNLRSTQAIYRFQRKKKV